MATYLGPGERAVKCEKNSEAKESRGGEDFPGFSSPGGILTRDFHPRFENQKPFTTSAGTFTPRSFQ